MQYILNQTACTDEALLEIFPKVLATLFTKSMTTDPLTPNTHLLTMSSVRPAEGDSNVCLVALISILEGLRGLQI